MPHANGRAAFPLANTRRAVKNRVGQETGTIMAEEQPSLHIDTDWKKQAQQEKKRLAEQEAQRAAKAPPAAPAPVASAVAPAVASAPAGRRGARGEREIPPASFATVVQSFWTQSMLYLGEIAPAGAEPMVNLDMARQQLDLLNVLEEKTHGNLTPDEQHLLDTALYESRTRFISVASQYI